MSRSSAAETRQRGAEAIRRSNLLPLVSRTSLAGSGVGLDDVIEAEVQRLVGDVWRRPPEGECLAAVIPPDVVGQ